MTEALTLRPTEKEFGAIFSQLAIQLRWLDADAIAISMYFKTLSDFPIDILRASARRLARESGRKFFPTTAEWREAALIEEQVKLRREFENDPKTWRVECMTCDDSGWSLHECEGTNLCGREQKHPPHSYVRVCGCRENNRTYQRHRAAETKR